MRILYFCAGRDISTSNDMGAGIKVRHIYSSLKSLGYDVELLLMADIGKASSNLASANTQKKRGSIYRLIRLNNKIFKLAEVILNLIHSMKYAILYNRRIHEFNPAFIVERMSVLSINNLLFNRHRTLVLEWIGPVTSELAVLFGTTFCSKLIGLYEDLIYSRANFILMPSQYSKNFINKRYWNKVIVCGIGLSSELIEKYRHEAEDAALNKDVVTICYTGSFTYYHNVRLLLEAIQIVNSKSIPIKYRLLLVGRGGNKDSLIGFAMKNGISNIQFIETMPNNQVYKILLKSDIAVLPGSTQYIYPIKLLEYAITRNAIVAPDIPVIREVLGSDNARLFDEKSAESMADNIAELIVDSHLRKDLAYKCYKDVSTKFRMEDQWATAIKTIKEKM